MTKSKFSLASFIAEGSASGDKAVRGPSDVVGSELAQVATRVNDGIAPVLAVSGLKKPEQEKFQESAIDLVTSAEFVDRLSEKIGVPREGESKAQFVSRAKSDLRALLAEKLLGKQ
ncbi:TPA: hypothetical protein QEL15_001103 [Stenotrophomonas maltophilia]|nr:hypothetical protein [Stenotrophomonas maltophilia]